MAAGHCGSRQEVSFSEGGQRELAVTRREKALQGDCDRPHFPQDHHDSISTHGVLPKLRYSLINR